ncbi:Na+/H+ antiporter subunit G [bacterium]|nr:Na+/H+ antiporter subunit G [bacterium]
MNDMATIILISIGVLFNIFGCIGLIRLPDMYNRLQAATKCVTLGCCSILLGVMAHFGFGSAGFKVLVAIPILFFTATVAAHALVRGAYHFGAKMDKRSVKDDYMEAVK